MRIRRVKGLTGTQIGVACFVGVLGGFYIWKPLFQRYHSEHNKKEDK